jgi:excinuclease ABC subunit C
VLGLFSQSLFAGFGPSRLSPASAVPPLHQIHANKATALRRQVREVCPRRPGVYGMVNANGALIYVGKAKCLRSRLLSYFRPKSRDPKAGRILAHTRTLVWEFAPSEFAALLRELELIRRWRPRFNVQGQPRRRRRTFVCIGRRPAPYVFLAPRPTASALACFGPVPAGPTAREAVRRLNDWFRLRDCPQSQEMFFADQGELFPVARAPGCIRYDLGTCSGPCAALCSRSAYTDQVRAAQAFLAGTDLTLLESLQRDMEAAAADQAFERAAALRDRLAAVRWLHEHLERLRQARQHDSFVYPVAGHATEDLWYLIQGGRVVAVLPVPGDADHRQATAVVIQQIYQQKPASVALTDAEEMDAVLLVAGWFRRHPEERTRVLLADQALALCGGAALTGPSS